MNIEILGRQALSILKSRAKLPESGFLAGGSLGNVIWELVSGNKAIINDIDVFILNQVIPKNINQDEKPLFEYKEEQTNYFEEYSGMSWFSETKEYYRIIEARNEDIINTVYYEATTTDPLIIINSFDINCTRVGYSIDEDKIYWSKDFEDFLKTGELKISNLRTPAHTAIRIVKKSNELNAKMNDFELKLVQHSLSYGFTDILRRRFKERYFGLFTKYKDSLEPFFTIEQDVDIENFIKTKFNDNSKIWTLIPKLEKKEEEVDDDDVFSFISCAIWEQIFNDNNLSYINSSNEFLFYMRNIFNNDKLKPVWTKLKWFFNDVDYVDTSISQDDLNLLNRLSINAPFVINNLRGYKLSEQLEIVKKLLDNYKDDPIIAISLLEKMRIDKDIVLDEETSLILELSVRKEIVNDTRGKVSKILEN